MPDLILWRSFNSKTLKIPSFINSNFQTFPDPEYYFIFEIYIVLFVTQGKMDLYPSQSKHDPFIPNAQIFERTESSLWSFKPRAIAELSYERA